MSNYRLIKTFLLTLFLVITPFKASASRTICASPEETVMQFYKWYLDEIKSKRYPLTNNYKGDKNKLENWVAKGLLKELKYPESQDEMDYDYFTYAQDFFELWLDHVNAKSIHEDVAYSEVLLSLSENITLRKYLVELERERCWKITSVKYIN